MLNSIKDFGEYDYQNSHPQHMILLEVSHSAKIYEFVSLIINTEISYFLPIKINSHPFSITVPFPIFESQLTITNPRKSKLIQNP